MVRMFSIICLLALLSGCGGVQPRTVEVPQAAAVDEAKEIFKRYSEGGQVASEIESFPQIVSRIREEDPAKAKIVEDAVAKITSNPRNAETVAKETLKKLE